jgi:hypothetical protein
MGRAAKKRETPSLFVCDRDRAGAIAVWRRATKSAFSEKSPGLGSRKHFLSAAKKDPSTRAVDRQFDAAAESDAPGDGAPSRDGRLCCERDGHRSRGGRRERGVRVFPRVLHIDLGALGRPEVGVRDGPH